MISIEESALDKSADNGADSTWIRDVLGLLAAGFATAVTVSLAIVAVSYLVVA